MPDPDQPVVSTTEVVPAPVDEPDYVAKEPIFINGVRAYNAGDPVTAAAVKNNDLRKLVDKPGK